MDNAQAFRIVSALANGVNPLSGEVFPADSPYQAADIIRALYAAVRAMDINRPQMSTQTSTQSSPQTTIQTTTQTPTQMSAQTSNVSSQPTVSGQQVTRSATIGNAGKPWSADEDHQLLAAFDSGKSLSEIAQVHGRTQGGVRARLEKHGRLEPSPATRWPAGKTESNQARSTPMRTGAS